MVTEIAGINYIIHDNSVDQGIEKSLKPFHLERCNFQNPQLNIHIKRNELIEFNPQWRKMFNTDGSWSIYESGAVWYIINSPNQFEHPLWMAEVSKNFQFMNIYCPALKYDGVGYKNALVNPFRYPLDQIITMLILANCNGAIIHSAGIEILGKIYIFPGKSGAGKSTITGEFLNDSKHKLLSDDRIAVRYMDCEYKAFGTPWPGEAGVAINDDGPLGGIFFIKHSNNNYIKEVPPIDAFKKLIPVTSIPWYDRELVPKLFDLLENLVKNIPAFELQFRPDEEVVHFLEDFVEKTI